nr:probable rhamnogalacturonate lyase B isoform X1 [Ipomoea batatas]
MSAAAVQLIQQVDQVVVDNGIFQLRLTNPGGTIVGIQYGGIDNLLELSNPSLNGGFWDLNWSAAGSSGTRGNFDTIEGTSFQVITFSDEVVELSFTRKWDPSLQGEHSPLSIDKRFIILQGSPGFYSYAIYEHTEDMPAFNLNETRIAFMLKIEKQRFLPLPEDRLSPRGEELAYPEAVLLVDPVEPEFKGEVDDKYQYSCENKDNKVHGFICFDPPVGFWQITPSNEFRTGGPIKQDLTSHVNPTTLAMFVSTHYGGEDLVIKFAPGEPWKKVFGPVFIYLNSVVDRDDAYSLWDDAKEQGYQFWTKADSEGVFMINNIRPGDYNLYAWVPGFVGDYKCAEAIEITAGCEIDVGDLVYNPPRNGPTLWEIGCPDRTAAEFFIPEPDPMYINKLLVNLPAERFRQYGLWERYAELYPDGDLVYTVGTSDYQKDWFYAHMRINDPEASPPEFSSGLIGSDNAIARHGIHGLYYLFNIEIQSGKLLQGDNNVYLTQSRNTSALHGLMYDYIRLEGPPTPNPI